MKKLDFYYDQFCGWAEEFEDAGLEQRKMIICQLVREINVSNILLLPRMSDIIKPSWRKGWAT